MVTSDDAREAYINSLKSAGMSEEDARKFANLEQNQDLFENWARNNGFSEVINDRQMVTSDDAKAVYIDSLKSAGMSEEVTPSAFAIHLYADGNNPVFETLEDAMAYAAAHPELEEEWTKNNEVQDNIKDEFDPSHALSPGDEIPPASAQMGESKPANEKLTTRFKEWFKRNWRTVVALAVGVVVTAVAFDAVGGFDALAQMLSNGSPVLENSGTSVETINAVQNFTSPGPEMFNSNVDT